MRELNSYDINAVSGAGLTATDIIGMLDAGMSGKQIGRLGLKTATEERNIEWGKNVAGDAGVNDNGIKWFFDGTGYIVE